MQINRLVAGLGAAAMLCAAASASFNSLTSDSLISIDGSPDTGSTQERAVSSCHFTPLDVRTLAMMLVSPFVRTSFMRRL